MSDWSAHAISEAIEVLTANGVETHAWTVLSSSNRLVLELRPCGLIAKIVPAERHEELAREAAVAIHVAACNGPAATPASDVGPYRAKSIAVSVWNPVILLGQASEAATCGAYLELRQCLDSFRGSLPDFREAISAAQGLVNPKSRSLPDRDAAFLRGVFDSNSSSLSAFRWNDQALHGDPHSGNVVLTPEGPRWLDFESTCTGPVEWDLSALQSCAQRIPHDPGLHQVLVNLRRACVVAWCSAKRTPAAPDLEAIAYHLDELRAEA